MEKIQLEKHLKDIDTTLRLKYGEDSNTGVLAGMSGIALFQFYYAKYLDKDKNAEMGNQILTECIERINNGYDYPSYCTGIAGTGWVLDHLEQEGFMEVDCDTLLSEIDSYLYSKMAKALENGKYDFLHDSMGYAFYFLKRYERTKSEEFRNIYKAYLLEFLETLYSMSIKEEDGTLKWISVINPETGEMAYNLCLSHGMSSIIGILTKLGEYNDFKKPAINMLQGAIGYVLKYKNKDDGSFSLFPNYVPKDGNATYRSRIAWCYGDLGIGLRLWYASKLLDDKSLKKTSLTVLKHAAKRTSPKESMVMDAGVCHGSYGNAQVFHRMYKETGEKIFKETTAFWIQDGLNRASHKDGHCGYKQWFGKDGIWVNRVSLLEGIAGIGLVIIDYLADFDTAWDECLMIS